MTHSSQKSRTVSLSGQEPTDPPPGDACPAADRRERRKLLLVAYHFPPIQASTGTTRTLAFSRYLTEYGWDVCVLTIYPRAYESRAAGNLDLIPSWVKVERAWGLDSRRTLSFRDRYLRLLALPDRWQTWIVGGYLKGARLCRTWRPDAIMSTYPVPSAHVIGYLLHRRFQVPWVAEFRDPMLQDDYPENQWERRAFAKIEELVFGSAAEIVVTTDGCREFYLERYRSSPRITTIMNGYDPEMFARIVPIVQPSPAAKLVLLHSGILYPVERNPVPFFEAVRSLAGSGLLDAMEVEFRFRASGNEAEYMRITKSLGVDRWIKFEPALPYVAALEEMMQVDALMLFQASNCNEQIPAKTYEYFYCRKPILALTDPSGDTARLLESVGVKTIVPLEDSAAIAHELASFLAQLRGGSTHVVSAADARRFSRRTLTGELATVLDRVLAVAATDQSEAG